MPTGSCLRLTTGTGRQHALWRLRHVATREGAAPARCSGHGSQVVPLHKTKLLITFYCIKWQCRLHDAGSTTCINCGAINVSSFDAERRLGPHRFVHATGNASGGGVPRLVVLRPPFIIGSASHTHLPLQRGQVQYLTWPLGRVAEWRGSGSTTAAICIPMAFEYRYLLLLFSYSPSRPPAKPKSISPLSSSRLLSSRL
jgi:hypothetical protein